MVVPVQEKKARYTAKTIIVMQAIAKKHRQAVRDIACNTNAANVAGQKKRVLIIVILITVMPVIAKQRDTKIVVIVLRISVITPVVRTQNKTVLHILRIIARTMIAKSV